METQKEKLLAKARELPLTPGVYLMKDTSGEIIYVGKSKALRNRVSSYFHLGAAHTPKTAKMVSCVNDFDVIITKTEFEALVLECTLIKKYAPKYNILLKDDKGYPFIRFTLNEPYPSMSVVSKPAKDKAKYFGPYGGRNAAHNAISALRDGLKLPDCRRKFPRDIGKERPCLNYHLGKCVAVCTGNVSEEEYKALCEQAEMLLEGKYESLYRDIEKDMFKASDELRFELAAQLRDRMTAVKKLGEKQRITSFAMADKDVIGFGCSESQSAVVVLHYIGGTLLDKETYFTGYCTEEDAGEVLSDFITQYYAKRRTAPHEIIVSHEVEDIDVIGELLSELCEKKVWVHTPRKGEKKAMAGIAAANAKDEAFLLEQKEKRTGKALLMLQSALKLDAVPNRIESYDISNTSGSNIVAGMVVYENGKPKKNDYRRFRIKDITDTQDDIACMREVIRRRFTELKNENEKFNIIPDVILMDGGINQTKAAKEELEKLNISVPVYGMVKNEKHRTRAIVSPDGEEIGLTATPALFGFVGRIQEEVHRYSIGYHRTLRGKTGYSSALDGVKGVGDVRKTALLKKFKSIAAIKRADEAELAKVVPPNIAKKIKESLK